MPNKYCHECGNELIENAKFCSSCAAAVVSLSSNTPTPAPAPTPTVTPTPVQEQSIIEVPQFTFFESIDSGLRNYFNFEDRSSRSAYWFFVLFSYIASSVWQGFSVFQFGEDSLFYGLGSLLLFFPSISVSTRRLHDIGKSGWNQLWSFTIIGIPYVIYLLAQPTVSSNQYGDHPLMPDRSESNIQNAPKTKPASNTTKPSSPKENKPAVNDNLMTPSGTHERKSRSKTSVKVAGINPLAFGALVLIALAAIGYAVWTNQESSTPISTSIATPFGITEEQWEDVTEKTFHVTQLLGYDFNQIPGDVWEQGIATGSPSSVAAYMGDWLAASRAASSERYDPNLRTNMVYYCMTAGSGIGYCTCSLEYIESRLTQEEYITLDTKIVRGQEMSDKEFDVINGARSTCPIDSPKYSEIVRTNFVEACSGGQSEYCSCALEYLEYLMSEQEFNVFERMLSSGEELPAKEMQIYADTRSMCSALFR